MKSQLSSTVQRGFTYIELVIIIGLVGIISVVAISSWPTATAVLDAQAEQLAKDIRYTQMISMNRGARYRLNLLSDRYQISDSTGATPITHPYTGTTAAILERGTTLSWFGLTNNYIMFNGEGIPYIASSTPLAATALIILTASGGEIKTVTINAETGRVAVQ